MTRYLSLAEFWFLAEHVTGIGAGTLIGASRVDLAVSALHAPQAAVRWRMLTGSNASAEDGARCAKATVPSPTNMHQEPIRPLSAVIDVARPRAKGGFVP